jgi:diguanylate cyclase (GGDEF)-like protein
VATGTTATAAVATTATAAKLDGQIAPALTRVLLIEDDPAQVALLSLTLGLGDEMPIFLHPVGLLADGLAELRLAREERDPFDIVLLDLTLPDGSGIAAVRAVRETDPSLALVVLTASDDEELAAAAVSEGSQDFLVKNRADPYTVRRALRYAVERQRIRADLQRQMLVDDLTALNNRRGFLLLGRQLLKVAARTGQSVTLLFIDLDGMKAINDTYGHDQGDAALIATAAILRSVFRGADVLSRLGGDEFCVLMLHDERDIAGPIERLRAMADAQRSKHADWRLSMSIGLAHCVIADDCDIEELIRQADRAMYTEKVAKKRQRRPKPAKPAG